MRRGESGFALPLTVFLIAIITLLLTTAFTRVQSDRRLGDASGANVNAMAIAKASLHNYLGTRTTRPADGDSVRVNVTGGYGDVIAKVIRKPVDPLANWMYVVRAVGHVIDPTQGADPQAVRTIAQFAQWQTGQMDVLAAYTAANNLNIISTSGPAVYIYGHDYCGVSTSKPGVRIPTAGTSNDIPSGEGYFGTSTYWWTYASLVKSESGTDTSVAVATNIDWKAMTGGGFTPDYTSIQYGSDAYASQFVSGNATLNDNWGTGLLIVTGDLTFSGTSGSYWYGVILVGGRVFFNNTYYNYVLGTMASGLNKQMGTTVAATTIGNKTVYLYYDSCSVTTTISKLTGFAPITNGWVDNWATY